MWRTKITEDEKEDVLKKTGGVCAHCGKPIFIGYEYSTDHFVPLSKGGVDRLINMIPLCKNCNKEKNNKIVNPDEYIHYLNEKDHNELRKYYNSYLHSFRYFSTSSFFAEDEFFVTIPIPIKGSVKKKIPERKVTVQRATYEDLSDLYDYYCEYLEKKNVLDSEEAAAENLKLWFENGCIYFIKMNDSIKTMAVYMTGPASTKEGFRYDIRVLLFPKSNTYTSFQTTLEMISTLTEKLMRELGIHAIPISFGGVYNEPILGLIMNDIGLKPEFSENKKICWYKMIYKTDLSSNNLEEVNKVNEILGEVTENRIASLKDLQGF